MKKGTVQQMQEIYELESPGQPYGLSPARSSHSHRRIPMMQEIYDILERLEKLAEEAKWGQERSCTPPRLQGSHYYRDLFGELCEQRLSLADIEKQYVKRLSARNHRISDIHRITGMSRDKIRKLLTEIGSSHG